MSNNYKNIDDLFRDKFENFEFEPPEHVWNNIKSSIAGNKGNASAQNKSGKGIAGISIFIIVAGMLTAFLMNHDTPTHQFVYASEIDNIDNSNDFQTSSLLAVNLNETSNLNHVDITGPVTLKTSQPDSKSTDKRDKKKTRSKSKQAKKNSSFNTVFEKTINSDKISKTGITAKQQPGASTHTLLGPIQTMESNIHINKINQAETTNKTGQINQRSAFPLYTKPSSRPLKSDYGKKETWSYGVFFTPELIRYPSDNNFDNRSYSFELLANLNRNNFIIQSGIGLSRVTDNGNNKVDYNRYLGSYEDVYDVTFDTIQGEIVPTFYTETVHVFDTINHTIISPTKRKFTYFNIPLMVGYGNEGKRLGWFVKAGPSLSVLIDENAPDTQPGNFEDKIISNENDLPSRIKTNWQFTLSTGTTLKLGNNLKLSFEPVFRYYISSAYERNKLSTKHPYSIGLRTGLLLDF
ncbi:MAG: PorT family protein [Bacteroidales bacterium]|nr:PorT family protein [Bacteroidales bacterium]